MKHIRAVNRKARRIDEMVTSRKADIVALQTAEAARADGLHAVVFTGLGSGFSRRYRGSLPAG